MVYTEVDGIYRVYIDGTYTLKQTLDNGLLLRRMMLQNHLKCDKVNPKI